MSHFILNHQELFTTHDFLRGKASVNFELQEAQKGCYFVSFQLWSIRCCDLDQCSISL